MKGFLKDKWVLLLVLCVFIACKIPHLSYAYYWDECWPYASAIRAMWHNGISLMPNAIDTELSRGHPLLFHVLAAGWMKVFGASHISMHSFSLLISVILLVSVYEIGTRLFNQRVGALALILVALQEIFFVQSSFVMLEVSLALFCLLSMFYYVTGKYFWAGLFLTAAFFTKESGLVMGVLLGTDAFIHLFSKSETKRTSIIRFSSVAVPCILIGIFFFMQHQLFGWYVFPGHTDLIEHDWKSFWYKFRIVCVNDLFHSNLRYYFFILLLVVALLAAIKNKSVWFLSTFIPAFFVYYFVDDLRTGRILPGIPFFILFIIGWFITLWVINKKEEFRGNNKGQFVMLAGSFVLLYLCFSGINFYTTRYAIAGIVPLYMILGILLDSYITQSYKLLYYPVIVAIGIIGYFSFNSNQRFGDTDSGAFDALSVQQDVVKTLEEHGDYNLKIGTSSYLERIHLTNPSTGFLIGEKVFTDVNWQIGINTQIAIFDNIEGDNRHDSVKNNPAFQLEYRFQKGKVWAEIYKRK